MKTLTDMIAKLKRVNSNIGKMKDDLGRELANLGWDEAHAVLQNHVYSGQTIESLTAEVGKRGKNEHVYELYMESPAALFVEFGAGLLGQGHPKAAELGMGTGTYPGQTHAEDPNGWWFETDDPQLIVRTSEKTGKTYGHTYGNPPYMPMYLAAKKIKQEAGKVTAKLVKETLRDD